MIRKLDANNAKKGDLANQLKRVGRVIELLELAQGDAKASKMAEVEMIVTSALNLVFSTYYLHLRREYMEKENALEVGNSTTHEKAE